MGLSSKQVSSDVQDWSQGLLKSNSDNSGSASSMELPKPPIKRQQQEQQQPEKLKCPRCDSSNTKFCYYNNYNKSQPRHYCKACKRHWTKDGMLRNVPVGGGRKNKRLKTSSNASKSATSASISVQASDQRLSSLPIRMENENSMKKMLNQADLGPQSFLQDRLFSNTMDFCIGKSSSNGNGYNGMFGGSSVLSIPQNLDMQFPCPSFNTLEENYMCSTPGSCHIANPYGLESNALESVVPGYDQTSLSCSSMNDKSWPSNESTSNWIWDDIGKFATSDVTISWDDAEI